jgi:ABC-type amino acid transport substrate-binding protein
VNTLKGDINGPGDLPGKIVATIGGSAAESWLTGHDVPEKNLRLFPTIQACIEALKEHKVKAVVYDAPILKYNVNSAKDDNLILVPGVFSPGNYGFALQQDSPLRERLNQALLTLSENGTIQLLREKYFGKDE